MRATSLKKHTLTIFANGRSACNIDISATEVHRAIARSLVTEDKIDVVGGARGLVINPDTGVAHHESRGRSYIHKAAIIGEGA